MRDKVLSCYRKLLRGISLLPPCVLRLAMAVCPHDVRTGLSLDWHAVYAVRSTRQRLNDTRWCRKAQGYYRVYVRENFVSWNDEEDHDKIQALIDKAEHDMKYILDKVRSFIGLRGRHVHGKSAVFCCCYCSPKTVFVMV
jgi:hypothetical protein